MFCNCLHVHTCFTPLQKSTLKIKHVRPQSDDTVQLHTAAGQQGLIQSSYDAIMDAVNELEPNMPGYIGIRFGSTGGFELHSLSNKTASFCGIQLPWDSLNCKDKDPLKAEVQVLELM
jgi:hypothetical protein